MRRESAIVVVLFCALAAQAQGGTEPPGLRCSMALDVFAGTLKETHLLAEFLDTVVEADPGPVESTDFAGHATRPDPGGRIWGQYVRVHGAFGRASEVFGGSRTTGGSAAVLVLWDYDAGCAPTRYGGPMPLGVVGDTALVRARLRDRSEWVDDVPTFDSFWGGELVYEVVSLTAWRSRLLDFRREYPVPGWERFERLAPVEVFRLITELPAPCEYVWAPESAAARLIRVDLAHLGDHRYPVQEILASHRRRMGSAASEIPWCYQDPRIRWWEEPW